MPSLPPEIVYFPLWMPFNLYDFACWARGTVAPLTIVVSQRPVRELGVDVEEVVFAGTERRSRRVPGRRHWLMVVERLQKLYERLPLQPSFGTPNGVSRNGWSSDKKPTAVGAASNRRGCTR